MSRSTEERVRFELSGGTFHALAVGDPGAPPLVFLHGFPDHPPTAAAFLAALAGHGHRVIAPWLRGYAPSPLAGPYDVETLATDVLELADQLGPIDLVGHDWGAAITYLACATAPARIKRAATLALPHPLTFLRALGRFAQARRSWYIALFQLPGAEQITRARGLALIDLLWRRWSPGFELPATARAELHACLEASLPAPLAMYRAMLRPIGTAVGRIRRGTPVIETPLLQLHGADDGCVIPPTDADGTRFADRVLEIVPGVGHFLHVERPTAIADRIARWLAHQ